MNLTTEKKSHTSSVDLCPEPIFILGIMTRSGTNFLYNALSMHPDCCGVNTDQMPEDHFLANANLLRRYVSNVASYWGRHGRLGQNDLDWQKNNTALKTNLLSSLGNGIIHHLNTLKGSSHKPLLTRTPNVRNLSHFFELFPQARLIILVRDGRAVVESNVKSFGANYESDMQRWTEAAKSILEFDECYKGTDYPYLIVRYEDILDNFQDKITEILEFIGLNIHSFNFKKAESLPIFGSSENYEKLNQSDKANSDSKGWKVMEKSSNFKPKARWKTWSKTQHQRFNWVAGDYMTQFGYYLEPAEVGIIGHWRNRLADWRWAMLVKLFSIISQVEQTLYAIWRIKSDYKNLRME